MGRAKVMLGQACMAGCFPLPLLAQLKSVDTRSVCLSASLDLLKRREVMKGTLGQVSRLYKASTLERRVRIHLSPSIIFQPPKTPTLHSSAEYYVVPQAYHPLRPQGWP
jgi:hypothetical protein